MPTVAVIGAGISGLMCARMLADNGFPVTVFEKSRGVGGRMATRRTNDGLRFDHGAQYFTARDLPFTRYVESWIEDGIVKRWQRRIVVLEKGTIKEEKTGTNRFVAVPGMNAICKHLAADLDVRLQTRVAPPHRDDGVWHLTGNDGTGLGTFDVAVVSAPAGQTADLLEAAPALATRIRCTVMHECWAVMLAFRQSLELDFGGAFVHGSPLSWIACNSSKPGHNAKPETWVLHASAEWSHAHREASAESVEDLLTHEFWMAIGHPTTHAVYSTAHRWRFALSPEPLVERCLFDAKIKLAACGDWCAGPRVEGAFLSGRSVAHRVLGLLETGEPPRVTDVE